MEKLISYEQREFVLISGPAFLFLGWALLKGTEWELLVKVICNMSVNNEASLCVGLEDLATLFSYLILGRINWILLENNIFLPLQPV